MKLIKPKFEIIEQEPGLEGIYKAIELAGRTCYKSEDKITPVSAEEFVNRMIKSGHHAMLEFGTVYLMAETKDFVGPDGYVIYVNPLEKYENNPYSKVEIDVDDNFYITTNYRVLVEHNWLNDLKYLCEPTEDHEKRICAKFVTDRGVSHELVRHRVFSFAQESTRYCNYSKDKFGKELTFIIPSWLAIPEGNIQKSEYLTADGILGCSTLKGAKEYIDALGTIQNKLSIVSYLNQLMLSEENYFQLLNSKWTPQQARDVLPNALKTEINMCGFVSDWEKFFKLRDDKAAHPDMQLLAKPLHEEFIKRGYIKN